MKKIIRVGCCGFPVAKEKYFSEFDCIEINITFYQIPELNTAKKWVQQVKEVFSQKKSEVESLEFEFIIKSWQLITHPATSFTYRRLKEKIEPTKKNNYGMFQNTKEVFQAWQRTKEFALELGCKKILFQCPASFTPTEVNLKNMYNFFKKISKDKKKYNFDFIIELRGEQWDKKIVGKLAKDLDLIHCVDPLYAKSYYGDYRYYRLHGLHTANRLNYNYTFSDEELKKVITLCDKKLNYVMFNNSTMYDDALRFKQYL